MGSLLTKEIFIERANVVHDSTFDYSLVEYINITTKVKIICPEHGVFEQNPKGHLNGNCCPKCGNNIRSNNSRKNNDYFIEKSKKIHKNKYDYSLVNYHDNKTNVKIICPDHGVFEQLPNSHLNGHGCFKCGYVEKANNTKRTTSQFIEKSKKIHNNKYDYSLVDYINIKSKVKIICPVHGVFEQRTDAHLNGHGCLKCVKTIITTEDFIINANKIHKNKYDYSLVDYISTNSKVKIVCSKHGVFKQAPSNHLKENGCPSCRQSKGENHIEEILKEHKVPYVKQKTFKNCKYKQILSFDFYLTEQNTLIEYDGKQHFMPIKHFGGVKNFENIKIRDKIKTEYCINNNILLLRIKYDENIKNKLENIINELK